MRVNMYIIHQSVIRYNSIFHCFLSRSTMTHFMSILWYSHLELKSFGYYDLFCLLLQKLILDFLTAGEPFSSFIDIHIC